MAILGSLKVTLRYVFYFWIGIKKSPKANDNGAFLEFWLREQDLNLRPSGYEPDELPDCSIPRQLSLNSLCGLSYRSQYFLYQNLRLQIIRISPAPVKPINESTSTHLPFYIKFKLFGAVG